MATKAPQAASPMHSVLASSSLLRPAGGCTVSTLLYLNSRIALITLIIHSCNRGILGLIIISSIVSIVSNSSSPARPQCEGPLQMAMTDMMREERVVRHLSTPVDGECRNGSKSTMIAAADGFPLLDCVVHMTP